MTTSADIAYERIREGIMRGRYALGAPLREEQLASEIGVSRTPVREALRRLNAESLVEFVPNAGARVARWSRDDLSEIFDLRAMLEGHAAFLAATRRTPAQAAQLQKLAEAMETVVAEAGDRAPDLETMATLNAQFHALVQKMSGTRRLPRLLERVIAVPIVMTTFHRYSRLGLQRSLSHHEQIAAAIAVGDGAWARAVMEAHIWAARDTLLRGEPPGTPVPDA